MSRCKSCSAPLPANINICRYCGIRNDIDLQGKFQYSTNNIHSQRICPQCHTHLQTIELNLNSQLLIEHCKTCFGLFFDPGEIETLLQSSVSTVFQINRELLHNINKERYQRHKKVSYVKCPVCQEWMKRKNFGYRSGVIINQCQQHGIWMGSGDMTHLMEWKKAGGQLLDEQQSQPQKNLREKQHKSDVTSILSSQKQDTDLPDLAETIASLIFKFFG